MPGSPQLPHTLQASTCSRSTPTLCPGLPVTGPFVSVLTSQGAAQTRFSTHSQAQLGPAPGPGPTLLGFRALLTAPSAL